MRVSGVLEGLSHALDLTEGHPRGHAARTCRIGLRLGQALGLSPADQTELLYALLLKDAGCSSNAPVVHDLFGGDDQEVKRAVWMRDWRRVPEQVAYALGIHRPWSRFVARMRRLGRFARLGPRGSGERIFTVRCERGAQIARMIGFPDRVAEAIRAMDEHWDGGGYPYGLRGHQTPLFARIIGLAQVMEIFWGEGGPRKALEVGARPPRPLVRSRRSSTPCAIIEDDSEFWTGSRDARLDADIVASVRPTSRLPADDERLDRIADAFAIDHRRQVTVYLRSLAPCGGVCHGHQRASRRPRCGAARLHRAGLLHDLGKLTVPNRILDKPGKLDADEWVDHQAASRLHPERARARPDFRASSRRCREPPRVDRREGILPRGSRAAALSTTARILAVADVVDALSADRPYRQGHAARPRARAS